MKNCADNILILFYFLFLGKKRGALSWPSEKHTFAKHWPSEKVTFAKRSPVTGQNCTIPRRPQIWISRHLSRLHAYSDVALKLTLTRRYKVYPIFFQKALQLFGFTSKELKALVDECTLISRRSSYYIWLNRFHQTFIPFQII